MDKNQEVPNGRRIRVRMVAAVAVAVVVLAAFMLLLEPSGKARASSTAAYWAVCPAAGPGCDSTTIQWAIDHASAGDTVRVVGNNVYTENLVITKSLTLLGGCNNATCTLRLPGVLPTTVDGHGAGRVATIEGEGSAITVALDGFIITGGDASSEARYPHSGGGVGSWNAHLTLQRNVITGNVAARASGGIGGGVYVESGTVVISRSQVVSNQAGTSPASDGGGIALHETSGWVSDNLVQDNVSGASGDGTGGGVNIEVCDDLAMTGNTIRDNTASASGAGYGGGIYVRASTAFTLTDNTIYANTGSVNGNGYGGGVYVYGSQAFVSGNTIRENLSSGATHGYGGGMEVTGESDVALDHNWVVSNTASLSQTVGTGGGLSFYTDVTATLSGDVVLSNTASPSGNGNGIYIGSHVLLIATNVIVAKNHASGSGGAIAVVPGGLSSTVTIVNSTVASNTYAGLSCSNNPTVTLVNLILWGNGNDLACAVVGSDDLSYSDVEDTADTGTGVIHQDPLFVDAANDDFHLQAGSPCINKGAGPSTYIWAPGEDRDGDIRPDWCFPDIGADEFITGLGCRYVHLPLVLRNY